MLRTVYFWNGKVIDKGITGHKNGPVADVVTEGGTRKVPAGLLGRTERQARENYHNSMLCGDGQEDMRHGDDNQGAL